MDQKLAVHLSFVLPMLINLLRSMRPSLDDAIDIPGFVDVEVDIKTGRAMVKQLVA